MLVINKCLDGRGREDTDVRYVTMDISRVILKSEGLLRPNLHYRWFDYSHAIMYGQLGEGLKVLDVGSLHSPLPYYMDEAYGCEVTSVDLHGLRERCRINEILGLNVKNELGDATRLRYANETFDRVFCISTIEHIEDDTRAILEMKRVLKPGGILMLTTDFGPEYVEYPHGLKGTPHSFLDARRYDEKELFEQIICPAEMGMVGDFDYNNVDLSKKENLSMFGKYTTASLFLVKGDGREPVMDYRRTSDIGAIEESYKEYMKIEKKERERRFDGLTGIARRLHYRTRICLGSISDFLFIRTGV